MNVRPQSISGQIGAPAKFGHGSTATALGLLADQRKLSLFISGITLEKVSGDDQTGARGGRLDEPLVGRVVDGATQTYF